ncbi:MAG: glycosyltransferase family 2 protein [Proteobacteria bacterium]|nr:glycosyltransferase family 2 protein [Pseudomonadota bacterium]
MPLISILTPAYNAAVTLAETAESIFAQRFTDWEWCVVDDASTDGTAEIIRRYAAKDSRIKPIFHENNDGAPAAAQAALALAGGRYVTVLDADDYWLPEKLSRQLAFMQKKNAALSFTAHRRMNENGKKLGPIIHPPAKLAYRDLLKNTAMPNSSMMVDRQITGPFNFRQVNYYDFATWLSLMAQGHVAYGLDEDLLRYRVRRHSLSSNKLKAIAKVWHIYRGVEKLPLGYSVYCLLSYGAHALAKRAGSP